MSGLQKEVSALKATVKEKEVIIQLYEEKVNDVLLSRKGLLKQKNALEGAFRALQSKQDGTGELAALSNSLTTLIGEKKRSESELKESKKRVVSELREAHSEIETLRKDLHRKDTEASQQIEEIKSKLIVEQHEREIEIQNHTSTLKELQKRLFEERSKKSKLMNNKNTAEANEEEIKSINNRSKSEQHPREEPLSTSLNSSKTVSADEINRLRKEMNEMELHHRQQLEKAETRALEAEKRSLETQEIQESRVINLELRLEELSGSVADYDRQRHEDQKSIAKLRERIAQLDTENCALTHVRGSDSMDAHDEQEDMNEEDVDTSTHSNRGITSLVERIIRLRSELRELNSQSENPIPDIDNYFNQDEKKDDMEDKGWKSKYFLLSDNFEDFKKNSSSTGSGNSLSLQAVLKSQESDRATIHSLNVEISDLTDKLGRLRTQVSSLEEGKATNEGKVRDLSSELHSAKISMSEALQSKEVELRKKTQTLESELEKQRERFLCSMQEKEDELKVMRDNLEMAIDNGFVSYMNRKSSGHINASQLDNLTEKLGLCVEDESRMMIHYSEETARKEKEVSGLRAQIRDLESAMREIQARFISKEEEYISEVERLSDEAAVLRRMSKSDLNVEYLKNVVVNYMLSSDIASKEHMLNAIAAVLVFSDKEVRRIKAFHSSWLWKKS